ncbi:MAG: hypothetical protein ACLR2E_18990 [Lachnospiraceae bacterium]
MIQRTGAAYKKQSGLLSAATLDRAQNAITYRVFGCEKERQEAYEADLTAYEKSAIKANIWNTAMPPVYRVISMAGLLFILCFGQKNVLGTGWKSWSIAAFTTFLACFVKLSVKSSSAAKLFNAVHKAQVSWNRIKPLMAPKEEPEEDRSQEKKSAGSSKWNMSTSLIPTERRSWMTFPLRRKKARLLVSRVLWPAENPRWEKFSSANIPMREAFPVMKKNFAR